MSSETTRIKCIGGPMHGRSVEIAYGQDDHDDQYDVVSIPDGPVFSIYRPHWERILSRIRRACDPANKQKLVEAYEEIDTLCDPSIARRVKAIIGGLV